MEREARKENKPLKIIVHHSAYARAGEQLSSINDWHRQREFSVSETGYFVGYHFLIEKSGHIVQTRSLDEEGAHTKGMNLVSIGVCLSGDFSTELPTDRQIAALGPLLASLCDRYQLTAADIEPHRHFRDTECYGTRLSDDWARVVYLEHENNILKKIRSWLLLALRTK